jgi:tetratricopeptide (TPR) repeat protein
MTRIYLSYSGDDGPQAIALRDWLKEKGWDDVVLEFDPDQVAQAADRSPPAWSETVMGCAAVVFLISRNWLASQERRDAYDVAGKLDKAVFVALIESLSPDELPLNAPQSDRLASLFSEKNNRSFRIGPTEGQEERQVFFSIEGLERLNAGLARVGVDPLSFDWPPQSDPDRAPYVGLGSFETQDAGIFFGREEQTIDALEALRGLAKASAPRLFVVLGASGVGKSSFLRAGLWPRLDRDNGHFLPLPIIRPGRAAISGPEGLLAALAGVDEKTKSEAGAAQIREALARDPNELRPLLRDIVARAAPAPAGAKPPMLVVAIDRADELFRAEGARESSSVLELLGALTAGDDPAVLVALAIRSESYDALARANPLRGVTPRIFPMGSMSRDGCRAAIERPAQRVTSAGGSLEIDPDLTQALLDDIEDVDALPLLAFALEQLHRASGPAKRLVRADYENSGRLSGAIDTALGRVFEAADEDSRIPKERQARLALLRRALVPGLAAVDAETRTARRRIAAAEQIPQDARPLIDLLVGERLLTQKLNSASGEITFELAHDVLLRRWGTLKTWLDEDFEKLGQLEGVKRASRRWDAHSRLRAYTTHVGALLEEAQRLYARPDFTARLDVTDRAYLAACMEEAKLVRQEEQEARSRAQEGLARNHESETRRAKNAKATAAISSIGLAAALAVAALVGRQWHEATQAKKEAQMQRDHSEKALVQMVGVANGLALTLAERLNDSAAAAVKADVLGKARELQEQARASGVAGDDLRRNESVVLNEIAQARLAMGDLKGALAAAQESAASMEALSSAKPGNANWRRDLSVSYEKLGEVQQAMGDLSGALKSYHDDLAIAEALSASDSANAQWLWDVSTSHEKIGDAQQAQNDLGGALNSYREALAIREKISASDPSEARWRRDLAVSHERVGAILAKQGDAKGAVAAFERALAIYDAHFRADPNDAQSLAFSIVPHWRLAQLDKAKERAHLEAAVEILHTLAAKDRLDAKRQAWLAQIEAQLRGLDQAAPSTQPTAEPARMNAR